MLNGLEAPSQDTKHTEERRTAQAVGVRGHNAFQSQVSVGGGVNLESSDQCQ